MTRKHGDQACGFSVTFLSCLFLAGFVSFASAFSLSEPLRTVPRVDYSQGLVFIEQWRGEQFVGVEAVVPLDEYLDWQLRESVKTGWKEQAEKSRQRKGFVADATGLIPDIKLPRLPLFGEGSKIDISGQERITLGVRLTSVEGIIRRPEFPMEQQLAVRLNGTIGERTKVSIDHSSKRREGQNKIKLEYTGTEDDIVQSVELGDTRLAIPGTAYTGDLPAHKGLFGVSAKGKMAGVDIYAVASREESQAQSQSFTGKRQVSIDTVYCRDYVRQRFFYIDAPGRLMGIRVYVDDKNPANNQSALRSIATVFPDFPDSIPTAWSWDRVGGDFDLRSLGRDYVVHPGNLLEFSRSLGPMDVVGLVIFTDQDTIGGATHKDSLVLKMLKPERPDSLSLTWDYEMKNVYALRQVNVQLSRARLFRRSLSGAEDTEYETAGPASGRKFLEFLGLDPNGDGRLEYPEFDSRTGLIRFPISRPFDSPDLSVREGIIYRREQLDPNQGRSYYLVIEYSSATESYYLGQLDIEENSERVRVNGELWTKGTHYDISYSLGTITFIVPLPAGADINITYEYRPWFSMSQKSLMGTRAEWGFAQNGKVGSSVFYRSEGVPEDKPALGSEPFRRMIAEADAAYSVSSDEVTSLIDRLPVIRAQAPSTLSASAEGAVSLPDPNTRGLAYLDDFESTTITRDVSNNAVLWSHASVPTGRDTTDFALNRLRWFTPTERIRKDSVFGPSIGDEGRETQDFLRVVVAPDSGRPESWTGMMTCPSQFGMNLKDIENLEMIVKARPGAGNLYVTVGMSIDEDAPRRNRQGEIVGYNGRLDTEDRNGNGILDLEEDTGLDGEFGADADWVIGSTDDGNDDYDPVTNPAGTEGNRRLDSEDLDKNGFSRHNHYFECTVPLGDERISTPLYGGWRLYRLPLQDTTIFRTVGSPKWEDIRLVRLWFDGFERTDTAEFYAVQFIGSRWRNPRLLRLAEPSEPPGGDTNNARIPQRRYAPPDTSERVWAAQISRKTDTTYVPPFEPKKDAFGRVEQEAALLFGYSGLRGDRLAAVEKTSGERDDFRDYREMRIYVHDDGNDLSFIIRFGADSANYYEYRAKVTDGELVPGRDGKWYEFSIQLDSFPRLKLIRDSLRPPGDTIVAGRYRLVGTPSLSDVRYSGLGFTFSGLGPKSGGLWFNDVRLTGPRRDAGYGFQARLNAGLSDLVAGSVAFNYSDPNFRRFSESRGVKTGGYGTSVNASFRASLERFLPYGWGLSIPLAYSISRQGDVPKYSPTHPDLLVATEPTAAVPSSAGSEDIALSNVRKQASRSRALNYTVEAMSFSWRQRRAVARAALSQDSSWSRALAWSYGISPDWSIELNEDLDLSLLPQGVRFGLSESKRSDARGARTGVRDSFRFERLEARGMSSDFAVEYSPLDDLEFDYGLESERDLLVGNPDTLWFLRTGSEVSRGENFSASYSIELGELINPSVSFDGDYSDDRPKLGTDYADFRNIENSGELGVNVAFDLPELLRRLGKGAGDRGRGAGPESLNPVAKADPLTPLRRAAGGFADIIDRIDIDYSFDRSSDLIRVTDRAPWHYRLGFTDQFAFDSLNPPSSVSRDRENSIRLSSGARVKDLRAAFSYDWTFSRDVSLLATTVDRSTSWPNLDLSLGGVQRLLPKLATDSKLASKYRQSHSISGDLNADTLAMYGRSETRSHDFSPLMSWTTTWKRRISTTASVGYATSSQTNYLSETGLNRSVTGSDNRSGDLSLSYSFTAPQGINLPLLKRVKFTSDLRLTWSARYAQTRRAATSWTGGVPGNRVPQQRDDSYSTRLAGSYSFSRTVEAGSNFGYSYTKGLSGIGTRSTDLDFWVLFRF